MSGSVQNLNEGRVEALQALRNVSNRLNDILGDTGLNDGTHRNENGELVNEEGLPIVDISEPLDDLETPSLTAATDDIMEDDLPKRFSQLSAGTRAIQRTRQDKILLMLEEEEEREAQRSREERLLERQRLKERARKEMKNRMTNQAGELEKRKKAKEFEKKMARALVGSLAESQTQTGEQTSTGAAMKKKTVSFADPLSQRDHPAETKHFGSAWGDAVSGRVSTTDPFTGAPMKIQVVERTTSKSVVNEPSSQINNEDQGHKSETTILTSISRGQESLKFKGALEDSDDESDNDTSDSIVLVDMEDGDVVLSAQHHRELALEYHRQREALIASAGNLPLEEQHFLEGKRLHPADWDKEDVPLEATLAHPPPKPSISKFKSSLVEKNVSSINSSNSSIVDPLGGSIVLPPNALTNSVRMGKLVDGKLVANPVDEDDFDKEVQEEEEIRKLLLRSMERYAEIGSPSMGERGTDWTNSHRQGTIPTGASSTPQLKLKPKTSRFKVNRSQVGRISETRSPSMQQTTTSVEDKSITQSKNNPGLTTPLTGGTRSSPKMNSSLGAVASSMKVSQSPPFGQPITVDSPFSIHFSPVTQVTSHMSPSVLDVNQQPAITNTQPSTSESQPSSKQVINKASMPVPQQKPPTVIPAPSARSSKQKGFVMLNMVKERVVDRIHINEDDVRSKPKKISRFKTERFGDEQP